MMSKAVTYDERPKMKRDTRQNSSPFPEKNTAFVGYLGLRQLKVLMELAALQPFAKDASGDLTSI